MGTWIRGLLWARRVKRRLKRMGATQSKTTQNVAVASTPAAAVLTLLSIVRGVSPDLMPWPPSVDAAICALLGGILMAVPVVSRKIALWRDPGKVEKKAAVEMLADLVVELDAEGVARAYQGAQEIVTFARKGKRPPKETPEERKVNWDVFAERLRAEAERARAARGAGGGQ